MIMMLGAMDCSFPGKACGWLRDAAVVTIEGYFLLLQGYRPNEQVKWSLRNGRSEMREVA